MDRERFVYKKRLNIPWLFLMAWRDSRRNRSRLFLFVSSIVLGIAALVATFSLGDNVRKDIDQQAQTLVGADLVIESNKPVGQKIRPMLDSLGDQRSEERTFASMIYFRKGGGTRLIQVRALQGGFPYYGSLETTPAPAGRQFRLHQEALVDKTLMLQFNAQVGDSIQIGDVAFAIAGVLNKAPGRTGLSTTVAPPVYIPLKYLEETGLVQKGSRVAVNFYYKFKPSTAIDKVVESIEPRLQKAGLDYDTVEERKRNTGRSFEDVNEFLTLISFIALLLGCIGVASAIHIYIREKISSIAILRCLGVNSGQAFLIYLIQIVGIGIVGSILGAVLGTIIQQVLPAVIKDFLPIEINAGISWPSIFKGIALGAVIAALFGLLPLLSVRKVSPLFTLRLSLEPVRSFADPFKWLVYTLILGFIVLFTWWQVHSWTQAIVFTVSILTAFLILAGIARLLMWLVRRFFPASWSYLWRQGFANLYRPNNQTIILITTIGLGALFISTLYFIQSMLISRVSLTGSGNQPNMVLFDIQNTQKDSVAALTRQYQLPILQQVPIVTMRIESINGKTAADVKNDTTSRISERAFEWEFRVTYRDSLTDSEKLTAGKLSGPVKYPGAIVPISMEEEYARRINVRMGDSITFNVQGALVSTVVNSMRKVDWQRVQTNFRVVFPPGVLELAPQFHVLITRVPSPEVSAKFQQAVVREYPNISIIDLHLILKVLDDVLSQIGFVIRFMAGFSIVTGLIVLIASVLISKYQRMQESVLLRTLGASRRQILAITALEYFFLGALAAATGILLSLAGSWALAKYSFKTPFSPDWWPIGVLFVAISGLTILIGIFNSRSVVNRPPLEVLRREV
ncbi:FtsX-like permease family protein [Paraflavitalea sp. CAU 1676]|uniref:ABC transporter permease n=1 Tax=Paraflavitalea sp. CAU 1676 TaxID=3032598 RepID=UPI0023D9CD32|nr:FtsX-like permease family protein [Paraflavitalea sp. CAU 1676]MDF2186791.1 FtsX-like permease family protein [Paraflavitalea sp. CAU 1676]